MTNKILTAGEPLEKELGFGDPLLEERDRDRRARRERSALYLRLLWSRRRLLVGAMLAGLIAAGVTAFLIPVRYTSTARLMPPDTQSSSGMAMMASLATKESQSLGALGSELLGAKATSDLFIGILQSRTVEDDLIQKFNLRKVYGESSLADARKELEKRIGASSDRKSGIITVSVGDSSPQRAQQMTQEYIAELNRVVVRSNTSSAHRERVFLEGRMAQVHDKLETAERDFSQFASKNAAIDIEAQGKAMIEAGATLEGQLIAAQTELQGLKQIFTDSSVQVRETQARVDELRRQLGKLAGSGPAVADPSGTANTVLYPPMRQLPLLGVDYADLYRRMKIEEAVFETLTQQYELAKVEEAKETPSVNLLDPANLPENKSFPPRVAIMLLGTAIAGVFAGAWVLACQKWARLEPGDPHKMFAVEVWNDVRHALSWLSRNGAGSNGNERSGQNQFGSSICDKTAAKANDQ
jgi:uncharacterized protein involved in exopolysaccharide biosynthesis